jgi:hypothetical protein
MEIFFFIIHQYDSSTKTNVWHKTLSAIEIQLDFFLLMFLLDVLVKGLKMMIGYEKLLEIS